MSGFDPSFMNFIVACKTSTTNQLQHQQISYHTRAAADHLQHCTADGENWISLSLSLSLFFCNRTGADARGRARVWRESTVEMKKKTRWAGREKGQHGWGMGRLKRADGEKEKGGGGPWR
jgi:hypothetical protein